MSELAQLRQQLGENPALLVYFGAPDCAVCQALRPKVETLIREEWPHFVYRYLDCRAMPEVAAQFGVFTVPTVIAFFEGREGIRQARNFSLQELREGLNRPYNLLFG